MTAKQFLITIRNLDKIIDTYQQEADMVYARLTSTTAHIKEVNVQTSKEDTMAVNVARLIELRQKINDSIDKYVDMKEVALEALEQMSNDNEKYVIMEYYFHHKTLEQIAVDMDNSYQWICELRNRGIEHFGDIVKKLKKFKALDGN